MINLKENKERFIELVTNNIKRDGVDRLLKYLDNTDFYTAPASSQYHLCETGGLVQHSLNVYDQLMKLYFGQDYANNVPDPEKTFEEDAQLENITLVALFHDLCKINCYVKDLRNVKKEGKWESVEYWRWDEKFPWSGHGSKSVFIIQQFMRLFTVEAQAICFHMGACDNTLGDAKSIGYAKVFESSLLALRMHIADMTASFEVEPRLFPKGE